MQVILKENMPNLGFRDEIVDVKPGYARNFLIPQGKAILATDSARKQLEEKLRQQEHKIEAERAAAQKIADKLIDIELKFIEKVNRQGRIYGSITAVTIADRLEEMGFEDINRQMLQMPTANVREEGEYIARVRLHKDVIVEVPFIVEAEVEEKVVVEEPAKEEKAEETAEETVEEVAEEATEEATEETTEEETEA